MYGPIWIILADWNTSGQSVSDSMSAQEEEITEKQLVTMANILTSWLTPGRFRT